MKRSIALVAAILLSGCAGTSGSLSRPGTVQVIDGHADFAIYYLKRAWAVDAYDIENGLPGQSDVPRWRTANIVGALATVGSDLPPGSKGHWPRVLASLDWFDRLVERHGRTLSFARTARDFELAARAGKTALMPAIEGGEQIDDSLANLRAAYGRGVRSMGIVYDRHNAIGDGAMAMPSARAATVRAHGGLSPFGRQVVTEMNRLGMIIDLSHAAESTALAAMALSRSPVIFSHSGARALADTPRNLSDPTLRAVARDGGIVMVPLVPYLTTTVHWRWWVSGEDKYAELQSAHAGDQDAIRRGMAEWDSANPEPAVGVGDVADQIEHVARVAGQDHVGIGTDFDGMGSFAIRGIADASALPALFAELQRRGWSRARLDKLAGGNFLRVLRSVEASAERN